MWVSLLLLLLLLASPSDVVGDLYDVLSPHLLPPDGGCIPWSELPTMDKYWFAGKPPTGAGSSCAQQGRGNPDAICWDYQTAEGMRCADNPLWRGPRDWGHDPMVESMYNNTLAHVIGSYCVAKATGNVTTCSSGMAVPEQINVQIASSSSVVVSWVTFEAEAPTSPPVVAANGSEVYGITHVHRACVQGTESYPGAAREERCNGGHPVPNARIYYMHFVRLSNLQPRARYEYKVRSGTATSSWSSMYAFRAPYSEGETKVALFGDLGVFAGNNMANLWEEAVVNETADVILFAGDIGYAQGDDDERQADAFMQAFEQVIANVPWMPIVGNHEFYQGTNLSRYLDSTWEKWGPIPSKHGWGGDLGLAGSTTADSALGALLSAGNHHGPGVHAAVPSRTSRYFSVNFGLLHVVALSLNSYNGVDLCTDECSFAQREWLRKDLAKVNRSETPWVVVSSHFPMYLDVPNSGQPAAASAAAYAHEPWFVAESCEYEGHNRNCTGGQDWQKAHDTAWQRNGPNTHCKPGEFQPGAATNCSATVDLEPLFYEFGVDVYWAGHVHYYSRFSGPIFMGRVLSNGTHNPRGTIHVTSGNAGPPALSPCTCDTYDATVGSQQCLICISQPYSYTRLTAYNATDLKWEQISNKDSMIIDSWTLHQERHGPFPIPAPPPPPPPPPLPMPTPGFMPQRGTCRDVSGLQGRHLAANKQNFSVCKAKCDALGARCDAFDLDGVAPFVGTSSEPLYPWCGIWGTTLTAADAGGVWQYACNGDCPSHNETRVCRGNSTISPANTCFPRTPGCKWLAGDNDGNQI